MDADRKRQILTAEDRFAQLERLRRALADKGVYVVGRLTHDAPFGPPCPTPNAADARDASVATPNGEPDA